MATTSRFVLLSSSVLLEYVYADRSVLNDVGNPYRVNTTTYPIWKLDNSSTGFVQILNSDSSEVIQDGLPVGTGNVRNRSWTRLPGNKGALLDIDKVVFYNDYDVNLTPTASLPISFTNPHAPVYDTIKLHLVQGFNFQNHKGLALEVKAKDKDGDDFSLCNLVYLRNDLWETLNPSPFFFAGRVYESYLEVRVLSLYDLVYDYWLGSLDGDTVVERITDGNGVLRTQPIQIEFSWIRERWVQEDQDYFDLTETVQRDIPVRDQFETIAATIQEATTADYIEFYASHNGAIIDQFITDLNRSGGDYIILHDLNLFEYVSNPEDGTYHWVKTDELQISQVDDFDLPKVYRPVIKNGSAQSFRIDYVVRLYNRNDNSQVFKAGSMISFATAKYGRKLKQINLGTNPIQTKVYNRRTIKDFSVIADKDPLADQTKYITSFVDSQSVSVSYQSVGESTDSTVQSAEFARVRSSSDKSQVYANGLARIFIPETTSFLRFVIHQRSDNGDTLLNLNSIGDLSLSFSSGKGDEVTIDEFPSVFASKGNGEVIFRISDIQAKSILGLEDRTFKIFLKNEKGDRTFVYGGKFFSVNEYQTLAETDRITLLERQNRSQLDTIESLKDQVDSQQAQIADLLSKSLNLSSTLSSDEELIASLKRTILEMSRKQAEINGKIDTNTDRTSKETGIVKPPKPKPTEAKDPTRTFLESSLSKNRVSVAKVDASPYKVTKK
jgi:uncharacterized coiled-coil protein SlyX